MVGHVAIPCLAGDVQHYLTCVPEIGSSVWQRHFQKLNQRQHTPPASLLSSKSNNQFTTNRQEMGRGKAWDVDDNAALARTWICASKNPVVWNDQKSMFFFETVHLWIAEKAPTFSGGMEGKYGVCSAENICKHVSYILHMPESLERHSAVCTRVSQPV